MAQGLLAFDPLWLPRPSMKPVCWLFLLPPDSPQATLASLRCLGNLLGLQSLAFLGLAGLLSRLAAAAVASLCRKSSLGLPHACGPLQGNSPRSQGFPLTQWEGREDRILRTCPECAQGTCNLQSLRGPRRP